MHGLLDTSCFCPSFTRKGLRSKERKKRIKCKDNITQKEDRNTFDLDHMTEPDFVYPAFRGINGCKPIKVIARGAFGKVHLVKMIDLEEHKQEAALKVFRDSDIMECEREKAVLENIAMHEKYAGKELQIAYIRDDIKGVECPNLMLEYIDGFDLNDNTLKIYPFSHLVNFVKNMMDQIGFGVLNDLHSMGIYHNDLKPANIMYNPSKKLFYLIDFGKAVPLSLLKQQEFRNTNFFTTLQFMSPWHLKLVNDSRYISDFEYISYCPWVFNKIYNYNISDNNKTRVYAANADFYSLALTAIRVLGLHCKVHIIEEPLCVMAKRIVDLQHRMFKGVDRKKFINGDIEKIDHWGWFNPYWRKIQREIKQFPDEHAELRATLASWLRTDDTHLY